jgi:hypothetical protein
MSVQTSLLFMALACLPESEVPAAVQDKGPKPPSATASRSFLGSGRLTHDPDHISPQTSRGIFFL